VASGIRDLQELSFANHPEAAAPCPSTAEQTQTDKSFLLLFCKKEDLKKVLFFFEKKNQKTFIR
jgi:hypothetical protein